MSVKPPEHIGSWHERYESTGSAASRLHPYAQLLSEEIAAIWTHRIGGPEAIAAVRLLDIRLHHSVNDGLTETFGESVRAKCGDCASSHTPGAACSMSGARLFDSHS